MRAVLTFIFCCIAFPALAQSPQDVEALTKKEQVAREKSEALESERKSVRNDVSNLKKKLAKTAREAQNVESELSRLEREAESLTRREEGLKTQISEDRSRYVELLAALQRLESSPPPTLALSPENAKRAADAGLLMATLSDSLKQRAEALSLNLTALDVTKSQIILKREELSQTRQKLDRETSQITAGLGEKSKLEAKLSDERKAAAAEADRLAAESKSLLELIAKLESEAAKVVPRQKPGRKASPAVVLPKGTKRFAEAKGGMLTPVAGQLRKKFGRGEKGLTYTGRPSGKVIAPYAGRVEFSGPFKNYDQVVILNVGDGYFVLLTGLNELYIGAGDTVQRGEPVGALPNRTGVELYIELRRDGSPVDPGPWMASADVKSG
ncbi:murein hydrolase activator EnvC family protein [Litorimonas cladophorae]|uniref:murein hydrolase activator EnvC family protein n=1 Tax=Litorimonas cladophorae TaxID=1220491 RepID=UPI0016722814|nr:peptidoglycan DD-metalloendopeptidase family protein [Litorimonas cladophorae]